MVFLSSGCATKSSNPIIIKDKKNQEFQREIWKVLYDMTYQVLYSKGYLYNKLGKYTELKIENLQSSQLGKEWRFSVVSPEYTALNITAQVGRRTGKIIEVDFDNMEVIPTPKTEGPNAVQNISGDDWNNNINRIAKEIADSKIEQNEQYLERKEREIENKYRIQYYEELGRLRGIHDNLRNFPSIISNYHNYRTIKEWQSRNHVYIVKDKELFREWLLYTAKNAPDEDMFKHYQHLGNLLGINFTRTDIESCKFPLLSNFLQYK